MKALLPLLLVLLLCAACAAEPGAPLTVLDFQEYHVSVEEGQNLAAAVYPEAVCFTYDETAHIVGIIYGAKEGEADCHIYTVFAAEDDRRVSRVAVDVTEGTLWFADMDTVDEPDAIWLREDFIGASPLAKQPAQREPYLDYQHNENADTLYMAGIDFIPEFTDINEGGAAWFPAEQTLELRITVGMGSHGTLEGPQLRLTVQWADDVPQITEKEFVPAPVFLHPQEVLNSGAKIFIEDERLIEIAALLRRMIEGYEGGEQP